MDIAEMPVAAEVKPEKDGAFYRPRREQLFTPEQQKAFDKAWSKREAKLRREADGMRKDLAARGVSGHEPACDLAR